MAALAQNDIARALRLRRGPFLRFADRLDLPPKLTEWIAAERAALDFQITKSAETHCVMLADAKDWLNLFVLAELLLKRRFDSPEFSLSWCLASLALKRNVAEAKQKLLGHSSADQATVARLLDSADRATTTIKAPLPIGRAKLINEIVRALEEMPPRHALITGEVGIGKSTVANGVMRVLAEAGRDTIFITCFRAEQSLGYAPIDRLLRELERHARQGERITYDNGDPRDSVQIDWTAIRSVILSHARRRQVLRPLIIFFDDIHFADDSTIGLLSQIMDSLTHEQIRIVAVSQGPPITRQPEVLRDFTSRLKEFVVDPLSAKDASELASALLRTDMELRPKPKLCRAIAAGSSGRPLFVIAICHTLQNRSDLPRNIAEDGSCLNLAGAPLDGYVQQYKSILDEQSAQLLDVMAVYGGSLEVAGWHSLCAIARSDVRRCLFALARSGLVRGEGPGKWRVAHEHFRKAIYETLAPEYRRVLHAEIADFLASDRTSQAVLAPHLAAAGMSSKAVVAAIRGARECKKRYAFQSAAELYRLAAANAQSEDQRTRLQLREAKSYIAAREWKSASTVLQSVPQTLAGRPHVERAVLEAYVSVRLEGLDLVASSRDGGILLDSEHVAAHPVLRALLQSALATAAIESGREVRLLPFTEVKQLILRCARNTDALFALLDYAAAASVLESVDVALSYLQSVRDLAEATGERHLIVSVYGSLAAVNVMAGNFKEAEVYFELHKRMAFELGLRGTLLAYWNNFGTVLCETDQLDRAERCLRRARRLSRRAGYLSLYAKALENHYIVRWELRQFEHLLTIPRFVARDYEAAYKPYALLAVVGLANLECGKLSFAKSIAAQLDSVLARAAATTGDQAYPQILIARVLGITEGRGAAIRRLEDARHRCTMNRPLDFFRLTLELASQLKGVDRDKSIRLTEQLAASAQRCGAFLLHRQASELLSRLS